SFPHFGIAYGSGIVQNLRARPWLALLVPAFLVAFGVAARRAARGADVVHAHWLPSGLAALATGRPFVLQVWGTDVELARRAPWLARPLVGRTRVVVASSSFLAAAAAELGAREVRVEAVGFVPPATLGAYYERAAVVCVPSRREGYGVVAREAMAYGRPVVATRVGGLVDAVEDGISGLLVAPDGLRAALERLLGDAEL